MMTRWIILATLVSLESPLMPGTSVPFKNTFFDIGYGHSEPDCDGTQSTPDLSYGRDICSMDVSDTRNCCFSVLMLGGIGLLDVN